MTHNGPNHNGVTAASILAQILAADGSSGGFIKDSQASAIGLSALGATDARALCAAIGAPYVIGKSGVAVPLTGTTAETVLATVTIPAGALGPNGQLRWHTHHSYTNGADDKTLRARLGGISGTVFQQNLNTTTASSRWSAYLANRNSASSQVFHALGSSGASCWGPVGGATATASVNTANAQDFVLTGQLENGADTLTLEAYIVELIYGA